MKCPYCKSENGKVIDTRPAEEGTAIRRRRECLSCSRRFTTHETVEGFSFVVIKQDNSRQPYSREKILRGIVRACEKRPIDFKTMETIADRIESDLFQSMVREVSSVELGERVMEQLKELDDVAYVRFASVHKRFSDVETFKRALEALISEREDKITS